MRHVLLMTACLACVMLAGTQTRAAEPVADGIGIYCDQIGQASCCVFSQYQTISVFVVASNLSSPSGIACWEAVVLLDPADWPEGITWSVAGEGALFAPQDVPVFRVAVPAGLPRADAMVLLTLTNFYTGGTRLLGLGPATPSQIDSAAPAYSPVDNPTAWKPMRVLYGQQASDQGWLNNLDGRVAAFITDRECDGLEDTDAISWSGVKRLYD